MSVTVSTGLVGAPARPSLTALTGTTRSAHTLFLEGKQVAVHRYEPRTRSPLRQDVVFLHGWGMSPDGYRAGLTVMASHGVRVSALTLPGYGRSSPLPVRGCGLHQHADFLATAIAAGDFDAPVHLTGHSFGGGIALRIAAQYPDLVDQVTVVCPAGGGGGPLLGLARGFLSRGGTAGFTDFVRSFTPALTRHGLSLTVSGLDARRADLSVDLLRAVDHGVDVHLIVADEDQVVPAGSLASPGTGARVSQVHGPHTWPHLQPARWASLTVGNRSGSYR